MPGFRSLDDLEALLWERTEFSAQNPDAFLLDRHLERYAQEGAKILISLRPGVVTAHVQSQWSLLHIEGVWSRRA